MYLDSVCIYNSVVTAHRRKIKTGFAFFDEVFLQPDNIACSVFLTLLIEIRSCKTTIAAKQEMDGWIIIQVLVENRLQEIGYTGTGISCSITELDFYQITSDSGITNERMVAITPIMEVKCPAFLFAVCYEERGIQIQDHCLRHLDAVDPFSKYLADFLELF